MFCTKCGGKLAEQAVFCGQCGTKRQETGGAINSHAVTESLIKKDSTITPDAKIDFILEDPLVQQPYEAAAASPEVEPNSGSGIMSNTVAFVTAYLLCMLPTYYLPYAGSNSVVVQGLTTAVTGKTTGAFWFHLAFSLALICIAFCRGPYLNKNWLATMPVLAAFFDLTPGLSSIPLIPTVAHILAVVFGVSGKIDTAYKPSQQKLLVSVCLVGICILIGLFRTTSTSSIGFASSKSTTRDSNVTASNPLGNENSVQNTNLIKGGLNPSWLGTWISSDGMKLAIAPSQIVVIWDGSSSTYKWLNEGMVPKKKGNWASYEQSFTTGDLLKKTINSEDKNTVNLLREISKNTNFKTVSLYETEKNGQVVSVGDCIWSYFYDQGFIYSFGDCQTDKGIDLAIKRFTKQQ
jgi:hypothetical protein